MVSFPRFENPEPQSLQSDTLNSIFKLVIDLGPKLASKWGLQQDDLPIARAIGEAGVRVGTGFCVAGVEHTTDELNTLADHAIHMIDGFALSKVRSDDDTDN